MTEFLQRLRKPEKHLSESYKTQSQSAKNAVIQKTCYEEAILTSGETLEGTDKNLNVKTNYGFFN